MNVINYNKSINIFLLLIKNMCKIFCLQIEKALKNVLTLTTSLQSMYVLVGVAQIPLMEPSCEWWEWKSWPLKGGGTLSRRQDGARNNTRRFGRPTLVRNYVACFPNISWNNTYVVFVYEKKKKTYVVFDELQRPQLSWLVSTCVSWRSSKGKGINDHSISILINSYFMAGFFFFF